jgi:hypothetical protein
MVSLVYASAAVRLFSEDDLVALLNRSRETNTRLKLSGMLLYKDGNFLRCSRGRKMPSIIYSKLSVRMIGIEGFFA